MKIDTAWLIIIIVLIIILIFVMRWCTTIDNFESFEFGETIQFINLGKDKKVCREVRSRYHLSDPVKMFNCGLLNLGGGEYFLTSRVSNASFGDGVWKSTPFYSECATKVIKLEKIRDEGDEGWKLIESNESFNQHPEFKGIEDVRPLRYRGKLMGIGSPRIGSVSQMVLFELNNPSNNHHLKFDSSRSQKNWGAVVLGDNQDELYFIYDVYPKHTILRMDPTTYECTEVYSTSPKTYPLIKDLRVGVIRAGKVLFETENNYIGVANIKNQTREYYIIFYRFEKHPPFTIIEWSQVYLPSLGAYFTYLFDVSDDGDGNVVFSWNLDDANSVLTIIPRSDILKLFKKM